MKNSLLILFSFLIVGAQISGCAFVTTYNDLDPPRFDRIGCENKNIFYRFYSLGKGPSDRSDPQKFERNEWQEKNLHEYLTQTNLLPNSSPDPKFDDAGYIARVKTFDEKHGERLFTEWASLHRVKKKEENHIRVDIFLTDGHRHMHHGSGSTMYGALISVLTLGIIPSYFTYDYDVKIRISDEAGKTLAEDRMKREGSQFGSIFLYLHSDHYSLFSGKEFRKRNNFMRALERMIGHQLKRNLRKICQSLPKNSR